MATCTLQYSADVARRAIHAFFWRRFRTPMGALYLTSFPIILGAVWFDYALSGADWFVGAFGFLIIFNLIIQLSVYFSMPRAYAKRLCDPANRSALVETSVDGAQITIGRNVSFLKWSAFKRVWFYEEFVILAMRPPLLRFVFLPTEGMTDDVRRDIEAAGLGTKIT